MVPPEVFRNDIKKCLKELDRRNKCKEYKKNFGICLNNYIIKDSNDNCKELYILMKKNKCFDLKT